MSHFATLLCVEQTTRYELHVRCGLTAQQFCWYLSRLYYLGISSIGLHKKVQSTDEKQVAVG